MDWRSGCPCSTSNCYGVKLADGRHVAVRACNMAPYTCWKLCCGSFCRFASRPKGTTDLPKYLHYKWKVLSWESRGASARIVSAADRSLWSQPQWSSWSRGHHPDSMTAMAWTYHAADTSRFDSAIWNWLWMRLTRSIARLRRRCFVSHQAQPNLSPTEHSCFQDCVDCLPMAQ